MRHWRCCDRETRRGLKQIADIRSIHKKRYTNIKVSCRHGSTTSMYTVLIHVGKHKWRPPMRVCRATIPNVNTRDFGHVLVRMSLIAIEDNLTKWIKGLDGRGRYLLL